MNLFPFHYSQGGSFQRNIQAGLAEGSAIAMTDSGFINNDIFLQWLQYFQKQPSPGKCVLILAGHYFYSSFMCRKGGVEMFCLPPHTTQALQIFERPVL
jgi:hypothetical protein